MSGADQLPLLAAAVFAAGLGAGVLAGLLGIGGGIVIVPALYFVFGLLGVDDGIRMQMAVGTSLMSIVPTSIRSLTSHHKRGAVDWNILRRWALPLVLGVLAGTAAASAMPGTVLTAVFTVLILLMAAKLVFVPESWQLGRQMPGGWTERIYAALSGFFSAVMGIGGGIFGVSFMTLYGMPILNAVATASGFGVVISLPGALGFMAGGWGVDGRPPLSLGFVNLLSAALLLPATWLAVPFGVRLAHGIGRVMLERAFALFLLVTAVSMAADLAAG
ncbi:MAG: sulfite exporter TauE/SafE family protein [Alphaproteobacteria bacterium]